MIDSHLQERWCVTPEDCGYIHENDIPSIERIKDNLKILMNCIYISGDISLMEDCIDEMCDEVGIKINEGTPIIEVKRKNDIFNFHLGYQRALIDQQKRTKRFL